MDVKRINLDEEICIDEPIAACIGYFDGLHKGHQALLEKTKLEARRQNAKSALITFCPDPKDVITNQIHKHIQSFAERLAIIEAMGIQMVIILDFDKRLCNQTADEFVSDILYKLNLKALICGFDFHYGHKGLGDHRSLALAAEGHFPLYVIASVNYEGIKISSTRVRTAIINGDVALAGELLGYMYHISGIVVHGKKIGRQIGFPTANLKTSDEILYPMDGVYLGYVKYQEKYYKSMINIGTNPTVAKGNKRTIEAYLLDFDQDIYGEKIIVYLHQKCRDVVRFANLDKLKEQLSQDVQKARGLPDGQCFIL